MEENYQNETTENQKTTEILETTECSAAFEAGQSTLQHMVSMAKWGKFMAIMTYIGMAMVLIAALIFIAFPYSLYTDVPAAGIAIGIAYLILGVLYFFPATYLLKGSESMLAAATAHDSGNFADAMKFNKKFWKFCGIYTIVTISLCILVCIAAMILALTIAPSANDMLMELGEEVAMNL